MPRVTKGKGRGRGAGGRNNTVSPPANSASRGKSRSTPGTRGRGTGTRRAREDYDQNPPTDAPSPKRITRQRASSTNAETQPPPLTEADIPRIVNAVLQGLPDTTAPPSTSRPDEEGDPEHFNGECVLCIFSFEWCCELTYVAKKKKKTPPPPPSLC